MRAMRSTCVILYCKRLWQWLLKRAPLWLRASPRFLLQWQYRPLPLDGAMHLEMLLRRWMLRILNHQSFSLSGWMLKYRRLPSLKRALNAIMAVTEETLVFKEETKPLEKKNHGPCGQKLKENWKYIFIDTNSTWALERGLLTIQ